MRTMMVTVTLALLAMVVVVAEGAAAPPPVDCTSVVLSMADCLSYVTNGSTIDKPEGNCCSGLKSVLKSNPDCLCEAFKSSSQFGVVLNVTKALALPSACHVHAPSPTNCGLSPSPAGGPAAGVVMPPAGAPSIANAPSAGFGASESAPAAAPGSKTGASSATSISIKLTIAGIVAVLFPSF